MRAGIFGEGRIHFGIFKGEKVLRFFHTGFPFKRDGRQSVQGRFFVDDLGQYIREVTNPEASEELVDRSSRRISSSERVDNDDQAVNDDWINDATDMIM